MHAFLAHSPTVRYPSGHALHKHLSETGALAHAFFTQAGMDGFAALALDIARHHDAGKYKAAFQARLTGSAQEKADHSTLGGQLLQKRYGAAGRIWAFAVLGHHGALPDGIQTEGGRRSLEARLAAPIDEEAAALFHAENPLPPPVQPPRVPACRLRGFELSMVVRMLHSALVDADYLDTERYFDPERFAARPPAKKPQDLTALYDTYMADLERRAPDTPVNRIRKDVRAQCDAAARLPKGFFTLTVPTGGGKTLASLGFALRHAQAHPELQRIVYAIPFTSIIEQNAKVFRDVLGVENVLEHHSAVDFKDDESHARLAAENWDAPLIVTTNVQLFESLYAAKPSACRKTHNLINSIIILDEAQALPDAMLKPCLAALCSLVRTYGSTVVLCTATQPDLSAVWPEKPETREIISDVAALFASLRRTRTINLGTLSDDALLSRLAAHDQALCIVNTRAHAQKLYRALAHRPGAFHLSALMCPEHRTQKLSEIRARMAGGEACIVISTSLVEAGVDLDFPFVYRARAGLDSVAQAAGRCNRNGCMKGLGEVYVFRPENETLPPYTARLAQYLNEVERLYEDVTSREAMDHFFRLRYGVKASRGDPLDKANILARIEEHGFDAYFPFESISRDFKLIQSAGEPLFIPYNGQAVQLLQKLRSGEDLKRTLRALSRYAVNVYPNQMRSLEQRGYVLRTGGAAVLDVPQAQLDALYTQDCGLTVDAEMKTLFDFT